MSKSQIRTLISLLCLVALGALIAGCEGQAGKPCEKAKAEKATCEKGKPAAEKLTAEKAKPAAEKPAAEKPKEAAAAPAAAKTQALGPYKFAANWMDEQGFITNWLVVGTFPNPGERPDNKGFNIDYFKNYGGETGITPANGMEIKKDDGTVVKWQQYNSTYTEISFFAIEHLKLEPAAEDILCYCACWIESDADKDVEIRVGSDDGYKLWLNHKQIAEVHEYRSAEMDQETHKVKLNKGMNLVIIKVDQDWGEYQFMLRVVTPEGKEVTGLKVWN
jgi:hypothetical protein